MEQNVFYETYGFSEDDLDQLLEEKKYQELREKINTLNEADIADYMQRLPDEQMLLVFRMLHKDLAADAFACLPVEEQQVLIDDFTDVELGDVLEDLHVDDVVDMLEELPAGVVRRVLKNTRPEQRSQINRFLQYPENSAGSIMTPETLAVNKEMTVYDTFDYIRANGEDCEMIYVLYVIDEGRHLEGVVTVKDLLMHPYEALIGDIMETKVVKCTTTDDQEDVAELLNRYDFLSLPVVDHENRLVGMVTVDDAVDVMTEETTEDIEKMAAIIPTEHSYFRTSIWDTWKSRTPWLLFLMISATFTSIIINSYESALAAWVALTGFIPMLMDTSGNAGSQSTVTVIRALSLGDIQFSQIFKVIWKEMRVAFVCGLTLAVVNFFKIYLVDGMLFHNPQITFQIDLVVCVTLFFTVLFAQFVGCILPMLADRIHLDPAVMASPLITTIVDASSLLIYFQVASRLLGL